VRAAARDFADRLADFAPAVRGRVTMAVTGR